MIRQSLTSPASQLGVGVLIGLHPIVLALFPMVHKFITYRYQGNANACLFG